MPDFKVKNPNVIAAWGAYNADLLTEFKGATSKGLEKEWEMRE